MADPATIDRLLEQATAEGLMRREAITLIAHAAERSRAWVLAHPEAQLNEHALERWQHLSRRRLDEEPLAYILESREFWSLTLKVNPAVLIPRIETESLVQVVLQEITDLSGPSIADLGTGSGAIILALGKERPDASLIGTDLSSEALAVARHNGLQHSVTVDWRQGHWLEALRGERVDVIVSNPPYVEPGDPHLDQGDLRFEPPAALIAEKSGYAAYHTIIDSASENLNEGGLLALEHGASQRSVLVEALAKAQFQQIQTFDDDYGVARVICARNPS